MNDTQSSPPQPPRESSRSAVAAGNPLSDSRHRAGVAPILRSPIAAAAPPSLGPLPRLLGLELYSPALVTRKVRIELSVVAAALLFVFVFEVAAWSFFLNGLFAGDMKRVHWFGTPAAVALALVFAGTILFFERQVVIADFPRLPRWKKVTAAVVRLVAIVVAGFIVAHAVDLLAFSEPIGRRLYVEAVESYSRTRDKDLTDIDRSLSPDSARGKAIGDQLAAAQKKIADDELRLEEAKGALEAAKLQERTMQGYLPTAPQTPSGRPRLDGAEADRERERALAAARELARLRGDRGAAQARVDAITVQLRDDRQAVVDLSGKGALFADDVERHREVMQILASRLLAWTTWLQQAEPGDHVEDWKVPEGVTDAEVKRWPELWRQPLQFDEPEWGFFEKVDALYDVVFHSSTDSLAVQSGGAALASRATPRQPVVYLLSFIGIHLAAMLVPLLVFTIKWFFMSREVDAYFSARHQAQAGDADARLMLVVDDRVEPGMDRGR